MTSSLGFLAAANANNNLYLLVAFGGGIISFLSPCVLPIVPGYLSLVSGLTLSEIETARSQQLRRIAITTGLFVSGFTLVFVILGLATTAVSQKLFDSQATLTRISGVLVLLMAIYLAGSQLLSTPSLYREFRFRPHIERFGLAAAPVAGIAFGLAWTPCIGPILGTVLGFAAQGQDLLWAALLLTAYSLGLGLSFLAVGLAFGRFAAPLKWVRKHSRGLTFLSAGVLGIFGLILITDQLSEVTARLSECMDALGLRGIVEIG